MGSTRFFYRAVLANSGLDPFWTSQIVKPTELPAFQAEGARKVDEWTSRV